VLRTVGSCAPKKLALIAKYSTDYKVGSRACLCVRPLSCHQINQSVRPSPSVCRELGGLTVRPSFFPVLCLSRLDRRRLRRWHQPATAPHTATRSPKHWLLWAQRWRRWQTETSRKVGPRRSEGERTVAATQRGAAGTRGVAACLRHAATATAATPAARMTQARRRRWEPAALTASGRPRAAKRSARCADWMGWSPEVAHCRTSSIALG
jgi:hypothetical protein